MICVLLTSEGEGVDYKVECECDARKEKKIVKGVMRVLE